MNTEEQEFTIFHAMGMFAEELKTNASFYEAWESHIAMTFISEYHILTKGVQVLDDRFIKILANNSAKKFLHQIINPPIPQL